MSVHYALEKFQAAAHVMATSSASIQERLRMAYMSFHPATENDMPTSESKATYRQLMETLTSVKDSERGYVPATTAQMSDAEGEAAADLIWDLRSQLSSWVKDNPNKGW